MADARDLAAIGLTYRQIDHWTSKGWIIADEPNPGSGKDRTWPWSEVAIARLILTLRRCGFMMSKAVELARHCNGQFVQLAEHVILGINLTDYTLPIVLGTNPILTVRYSRYDAKPTGFELRLANGEVIDLPASEMATLVATGLQHLRGGQLDPQLV